MSDDLYERFPRYCDREGGCLLCEYLMCDGTPRKMLEQKQETEEKTEDS